MVTNQFPLPGDESVSGICNRLKFLREKHFGSRGKRKFAQALGLPLSTYVNYEGQRVPPSDILVKVSEITHCDLNWLMTGQGYGDTHHAPDPELSEILVRMEKIISTQPKAKQAVKALMDLLSVPVEADQVSPGPPLFSADRNIIPVLGRVAAGEPAPWVQQDNSSLMSLAAMVSELDAGAIRKKDSLGLFIPDSDRPGESAEIIELCEPVVLGTLLVDRFIITSGVRSKGQLFAVTLTGDSMEPLIADGDFVIADPTAAITNGAIVLAELENRIGPVCKSYAQENTHIVLKSRNPDYEPIEIYKKQVKWVVKVIAAIKR